MHSYNKLLLRYFTPYLIVAGLLVATGGISGAYMAKHETKIIKTPTGIDYVLGAAMLFFLLYFFYIYAIEIPLEMRKKIRRIADKYLEYATTQNPEMAKVKDLLANKTFMNGVSNIVFNALTKEDRSYILQIIREYDAKDNTQNYDEKALNKELEDKIFATLKKRSLLDTNFNQNIFNNTLIYSQEKTK